MREKVPLLKCNHLRSGPGTIQLELNRLEGGAGMLLPNRDLRSCCTNTGCGYGVLPGRRNLLKFSKAPDGAIQWSHVEKEDRSWRCPEEPLKLCVVRSLLLQDLRVVVWLEGNSCWHRDSCLGVHRLGVVIGASRHSSRGNDQAQGKSKPMPHVLCCHASMVGISPVRCNRRPCPNQPPSAPASKSLTGKCLA